MTAPTLTHLLGRGYFPKELPPCFSTSKFAACVNTSADELACSLGKKWTKSARYNLARPGGTRRVLSIANPLAHLRLCQAIVDAWPHIESTLSRSRLSMSTPRIRDFGRAIGPKHGLSELIEPRLAHRAESAFMLRTDIQDFYPSLYTHSVPWALLGKAAAKSQMKDKNLVQNRLDERLRNVQDGQTKGIDVGPDASFAIAETILAACDRQLQRQVKGLRGFRFYDDYELYFHTRVNAEVALSRLQTILSDFELSLNPTKTQIVALPEPLEFGWALELRRYGVSAGSPTKQREELVNLFESAFQLMRRGAHEHVLHYAIGITSRSTMDAANWRTYEQLLSLT